MSPKVGMGPVRREQIVRATIRCLAREGYTRLTMKKVAREAGVSQGILHYYFEDKRAMLGRHAGGGHPRSRPPGGRGPVRAPAATGGPPARAGAAPAWRSAVQRPEFWVVFVEFWGEMLHDRRLRDSTPRCTRARVA